MRKLLFLQIVVIAGFFVACGNSGKSSGNGAAGDSAVDWNDSCMAAYLHIQNHYFAEEYDSMQAEVPAVMELCRQHQEWTVYYNAWERMAERFVWEEEFDRAAAEAEAMRADAAERQNDYGQAMAYYVLAQGYIVQDNYSEAARCYQQSVSHYPADENPSMLNLVYNFYSQALLHLGEYDRMDALLQQWQKLLDRYPVKADDPKRDLYANWRVLHGFCTYLLQMEHNQLDAAAQTLDSTAYYEVIDGNIPANINIIHCYRSKLANTRGHFAEALAYADSTLQMSVSIDSASVIGALEERTKALKGLGRYAEALADHERLKLLNDSIIQSDNRHQLNLLNKRFEVAELQLSHQRTLGHLYLACAAVVLLLVIVIFGVVYTRRIRQKNRKLYEQIMLLQKVEDTSAAEPAPSEVKNPLYASICDLMKTERPYTDADFSRDELAQRLGTNRTYVADAIREGSGGLSFQQFLTTYRIHHATRLLAETDDSIEQVAFASGFNSRQVFARAFHDQNGLSPSAFRRARES